MKLEEAIKHCEEKAKELRKDADYLDAPYGMDTSARTECLECANEHEQLAGWLKDYKRLLEMPKGDLISREALKKAVEELLNDTLDGIVKFGIRKAYEIIDNAPTVSENGLIAKDYIQEKMFFVKREYDNQPIPVIAVNDLVAFERPQGEWITKYDRLECPFCGMSIDDEVHWLYSEEYNFNFCPNCGAKMKGGAK